MDDLTSVMDWLDANEAKKNTPEYQQYVNAFTRLSAAPQAAAPKAPAATWEQLQTETKDLPETDRVKIVNDWANAQEKTAAAEGGWSRFGGDVKRSIVRGLPGGTWLDEAQSKISSMLPASAAPLCAGAGDPYEKTKALEDARTRRYEKEHPYLSFGGNVAGAMSVPVPGVGLAGRVATDTGIGALQGSGEGNTLGERARNAIIGGGMSAGMSALLNKAGSWYNRWTQQTPEVVEAGARQGVDLPFYATSSDPAVQAAGRQAAQSRPKVSATWDALNRDVTGVGERAQSAVTGAPSPVAPNVAGRDVTGAMPTVIDSLNTRLGALADQSRGRLPEGARGDMPALRQALEDIAAGRVEKGVLPNKVGAGLEQATNIATRPEGSTYQGMQGFARDVGESIGPRGLLPRKVSPAEEAKLYGATRGDQRRLIEETVKRTEGPWSGVQAGEKFAENLPKQQSIIELRKELAGLANKDPEQLISRAYQAASTKGSGTRLDDLALLVNALPPELQQKLGAGVLAHIQNTGGTPQGVASRLASIPQQARDLLFRPGSTLAQNVNDLMTLTGRVADINASRHVGSAATIAPKMGGMSAMDLLAALTTAGGAGAHAFGLPGATVAIPAGVALAAAPRIKTAVNTQLLNKGLPTPAAPQTLQDLLAQLAAGVSRESGYQIGPGR